MFETPCLASSSEPALLGIRESNIGESERDAMTEPHERPAAKSLSIVDARGGVNRFCL